MGWREPSGGAGVSVDEGGSGGAEGGRGVQARGGGGSGDAAVRRGGGVGELTVVAADHEGEAEAAAVGGEGGRGVANDWVGVGRRQGPHGTGRAGRGRAEPSSSLRASQTR